MTDPNASSFQPDVKAIAGAILGGIAFVLAPTWFAASTLAAPTLPLIGLVTGFLLAGIITGYLSDQETVAEPYIGAIIIALAAYILFSGSNLPSFANVTDGEFQPLFILACVNGLVATLAGAWTGEKLQRTYVQQGGSDLAWGWIFAGAVVGIGSVIFLAGIMIWAFGLSGGPGELVLPSKLWVLVVSLSLGTGVSGFLCAFRSPGDTAQETIIAGLVTAVLLFDLFYFGLGGDALITSLGLAAALGASLIASLIGGLFGEEVQTRKERAEELRRMKAQRAG